MIFKLIIIKTWPIKLQTLYLAFYKKPNHKKNFYAEKNQLFIGYNLFL